MVWKAVRIVLLVGLVALSAAMVWQHDRYLDARRHVVQDYQDPWHGEVFHVLTYLTVEDDAALITRLRLLNRAAREEGSGQLIYAGKVIHDGLVSPQIAEALGGQVAWNGIVLQQFEDRAAYDGYRADPAVKVKLFYTLVYLFSHFLLLV